MSERHLARVLSALLALMVASLIGGIAGTMLSRPQAALFCAAAVLCFAVIALVIMAIDLLKEAWR